MRNKLSIIYRLSLLPNALRQKKTRPVGTAIMTRTDCATGHILIITICLIYFSCINLFHLHQSHA